MKKKTDPAPSKAPEKKSRLRYRPFSDTLSIVLSAVLVTAIGLATFFLRPKATGGEHVEIKYGNLLLWDLEHPDTPDKTKIQFPESGERVIRFEKSDAPQFDPSLTEFDFYGDEVEVTLSSRHTVRITKEDSPRHICSNLGEEKDPYSPLVCLPNHIQVMIVPDSGSLPEFDA